MSNVFLGNILYLGLARFMTVLLIKAVFSARPSYYKVDIVLLSYKVKIGLFTCKSSIGVPILILWFTGNLTTTHQRQVSYAALKDRHMMLQY